MPDAVNPDRNSLVYVYAGDDGPADGDIVQFSATTGRWEAVQGGTSVPVKRAWYRSANQLIPSGGVPVPLTWTKIAGDTIFDLTDPTEPLQIDAGTLAVTINVCCADGAQVGKSAFIELDLDLNNDDATASETFSLDIDIAALAPQGSLSLTFFVPAAGIVRAYVMQQAGTDINFFLEAAVQWSSDTAAH